MKEWSKDQEEYGKREHQLVEQRKEEERKQLLLKEEEEKKTLASPGSEEEPMIQTLSPGERKEQKKSEHAAMLERPKQ
jgi:hypothetical protein